jgi:uncharacterized damage-inducible protein DinB
MLSLTRLYEHVAWANRRVLEALGAASAAGHADANANPHAALSLFAHLLQSERLWMQRVRGGPPSRDFWPTLTVEQCADLASANAVEYASAIARWTPEDLARPIRYRNSKGIEYLTPLSDILLHVALHGSYHRGQIASALRAAGSEPAMTDFVVFTREPPERNG